MGLDDKAKAAAKNLEGKAQETAGKIADNKEAQAKGKAKQVEAEARKAGENVKDGIKDAID
ncbi:MAG: CsbD family protein [Phormidium sp. BM_Day4_Bin.17]|nr:CsbD family protein [Phormidium sp. BM_Day4_Bin.17]UCJ12351.1 MAG: CsbD family protein [Phormidium sp. PBR-2020]